MWAKRTRLMAAIFILFQIASPAAQAMNLLLAVGNQELRTENIIQAINLVKERTIEVCSIEPAAGG